MAIPKFNKIIIDGIFYDILPYTFHPNFDEYGISSTVEFTFTGNNFVVVHGRANENDFSKRRKIYSRGWIVEFSGESPATSEMYDQLRTLYTLQKPFWIQFDNEMSRCYANLETVGTEYRSYYTPTYPIFPYGHEPGDDADDFTGCIFIDGELYSGSITVDRENGVITFPDTIVLTQQSRVQMKYTWRDYVTIAMFDGRNLQETTQNVYTISLLLESRELPAASTISWNTNPYN